MKKLLTLFSFLALLAVSCVKSPASITVSPDEIEITEGAEYRLAASVLPADARYDGITWSSSKPEIATVSDGLVTGISVGSAVITAAAGDVSGTAIVTVVSKTIPVTGVSLDSHELELIMDDTAQLTATVEPQDATGKAVVFSSDDPGIASVDQNGLVTAVTVGSTVIRVRTEDGGFQDSCQVTVVTGLKLYSIQPWKMYLNGEPDPVSGSFDTEAMRFSDAYSLDVDGSTLYSYEMYFGKLDAGYHSWLCVDRKPVLNIEQYIYYTDPLWTMSARNGTVALIYQKDLDRKNFVLRIRPDMSMEAVQLDPSLDHISGLVADVAPDGTIYVLADVTDKSDVSYIRLYALKTDGSVAETTLLQTSSSSYTIYVTDDGDLYYMLSEYDNDTSKYKLLLHKNGGLLSVVDAVEQFPSATFCVRDGHVYSAIQDYSANIITIRKDDERLYSIPVTGDYYIDEDSPLAVSSRGDVYLALYMPSGGGCIYRNDKVLYNGYFVPFCIIE